MSFMLGTVSVINMQDDKGKKKAKLKKCSCKKVKQLRTTKKGKKGE